ncbi:PLD nuclease N-terminal domain-containing protein [Mobiluncus mulieris]|uniref:PLD nuclease N-terminal domain-containing protein n=2 Tax=Mobiluncus mulieris TaxID=2052 RepID=UPI0009D66890|nr:PLD nuclease N-terminal domain-containing protein [Mobiluncus mulieris]MCU9995175.1 PLDc_N domain-containing protein [Mobiluncus mulieris]MCV0003511.1 PLDc_N domain-containing protein [Mobiluncus mulieris]SPX71137.1 Uncharacterised protein [Mobiluncus mulieris]
MNPMLPTFYDTFWILGTVTISALTIAAIITLVKSRIASKTKITWIVIVVFLPAVGSLLWLIYYTRTNHT